MRALASIGTTGDLKSLTGNSTLVPLLMQIRVGLISGLEQEFTRDPELAPLEITAAQFAILKNVLKGCAKSACDLCKSMDYDRGAMSRMIDRLEAKRLIRRVALAHTRRSVALEVTEAGRAAFPMMEACLHRVVERMLKGVTKAEVRQIENVLRQMLANA